MMLCKRLNRFFCVALNGPLKICIISGLYNPHKCGISDYVNLLSNALVKQGHDVIEITLSKNKSLADIAKSLPSSEIYSIQFAPYFFSPRGLVGSPLMQLAKKLRVKRLHINFHEIWIGAYPHSSFKEKFLGWRQRKEIKKFVEIVNPASVTCSNAATLDRLNSAKINANYLYLFSNIPYSRLDKQNIEKTIKIAIFGTLYEKFPYDLMFQKLKEITTIQKRDLQFRIVGRQREGKGLSLLKNLAQEFKFLFYESGELSTDSISHELQNCDLGLCTTPYDILGKSGATAAMLEHGLPIIAFDDGDTPKDKLFVIKEFEDQIFLLNDNRCVENLISSMGSERKPFFNGIKRTTKDMINLIS
jgi:glycosyltransferase involved in cell wall biosynthesis